MASRAKIKYSFCECLATTVLMYYQNDHSRYSIDYQMNDKAKQEYDLLQDILNLCCVYY